MKGFFKMLIFMEVLVIVLFFCVSFILSITLNHEVQWIVLPIVILIILAIMILAILINPIIEWWFNN